MLLLCGARCDFSILGSHLLQETPIYKYMLLSLFLFLGCVSEYDSSSLALHETSHFRIHFDERYFPKSDIEEFGVKKEEFLTDINRLLDLQFYEKIDTYLSLKHSPEKARAYYLMNGTIYESSRYVYNDDGHEIAHAVTIGVMGRSKVQLMTEGIAEFCSSEITNDSIFAFFAERYSGSFRGYSIRKLIEANYTLGDDFGGEEYLQSGAFLSFWATHFGIESLKQLYIFSTRYGDTLLINKIEEMSSLPFDSLENSFYTALLKHSSKDE